MCDTLFVCMHERVCICMSCSKMNRAGNACVLPGAYVCSCVCTYAFGVHLDACVEPSSFVSAQSCKSSMCMQHVGIHYCVCMVH